MLFDFLLRSVDEIAPWGQPAALSLSWFALTDGYYCIEVGTERLFHYSDQMTEILRAKNFDISGGYVEYQVVRLWEDLLEILPDVLAPIPPELAVYFSADAKRFDLLQAAQDWLSEGKDLDVGYESIEWLGHRKLNSLYLTAGPDIWFWSNDETVTVTWDNRACVQEGIHVWSASCGSYSMSRTMFLEEVRHFNDELIGAMQQRIDQISAGWNRPHIRIDLDGLRREQLERSESLEKRLRKPPNQTELKTTLAAIVAVSSL